jgi:hypothetical protein
MTAATVLGYRDSGVLTSGHGTTVASAEGGVTIGRSEDGTTTVPVPTSTGTHFSWDYWYSLQVTVAGSPTTHLSNRNIQLSGAAATGLHNWYKAVNSGSYVQPTTNLGVDSGSNGATPSGYTEVTTSPAVYDSSSITSGTGQNGKYVQNGWGIDNLYVGGGGSISTSSIDLIYDEGPIFAPIGLMLQADHRIQAIGLALAIALFAWQRIRRKHARQSAAQCVPG